jgi:hypothetical protein
MNRTGPNRDAAASLRSPPVAGRAEALLFVALALAAAGWWAWRAGTGLVYNDSYQYLSVAENLRRTGAAATSIVHFDVERAHGVVPAPVTTFPPGYPALVAALTWTGMPAAVAGVLVSLAAFILVLLLLRSAAVALDFSPTARRLTMLAWVMNAHASEYGATFLSESLFTGLAVAAVALLLPPERREGTDRRIVASGALVGLGYWVRYAGLFFAVALDIYALWRLVADRSRRRAWLLAVVVCDAIVAAGMTRNVLLAGTWRGGNVRFTAHPLSARLRDLVVTLISLVLGGISARPLFRVCAGLVLVAAAVVAATWAVRAARRRGGPILSRPVAALLLFVGTYAAASFYAALTTDISFSARLFVPVLPLLLLLAGTVATAVASPPPPSRTARAFAALPLWVFVAGYLGTNAQAMGIARVPPHVEVARMLSAEMPDGRALSSWIEANVAPDAVLLANPGQAMGYLTKRRTLSMVAGEYSDARWDEDEARLEMTRFGARYVIVLAGKARTEGSADSAFLRQLASGQSPYWLELAATNGEVLVYRVREVVTSRAMDSPGAPCVAASSPPSLGAWVPALATGEARGLADAMSRVAPAATPPASAARSACIAAGRGEYEPFQVVLPGGDAGLTGVRVTASDLLGPGDARIPAQDVHLFREVYTRLPAHSTCGFRDRCGKDGSHGNRSLGPGTYTDGLIPFTTSTGAPNPVASPFDVPPRENQPIWIEVFVPRGAGSPAGRYTGSVSVSSDQGTATVPVSLTVWNFELPLAPSEMTAFNIGGEWKGSKNYENPACMEFLLRHKISPQWLGPTQGPAQARDFASRLGLTATEPRGFGTTWEGCRIRSGSGGGPPAASAFTSAEARWPAGITLYVWTADEIGDKGPDNGACYYPDVLAWARAMHTGSRFKQLITMRPAAALLDDGLGGGRSAVDIWAPYASAFQSHRHDPAFVAARKKGDEFWPYWGLAGDSYAPRAMIDFPPLNNRQMVGFIAASVGVQGALYWQVDYWFRGYPRIPVDPWKEVPTYVNADGDTGFGDGALVYPGEEVGAGADCFAPTLRLKWIREGIEDYEYAQLAKRAGVPNWLEIVRTAAIDYATWTKDPAVLAQARLTLARAIDALSRR